MVNYENLRKSKDPEIQNRLREESEHENQLYEENKMKNDPAYKAMVDSGARHKEHR